MPTEDEGARSELQQSPVEGVAVPTALAAAGAGAAAGAAAAAGRRSYAAVASARASLVAADAAAARAVGEHAAGLSRAARAVPVATAVPVNRGPVAVGTAVAVGVQPGWGEDSILPAGDLRSACCCLIALSLLQIFTLQGSLGLAVGGLLLCGRLDARLLSQRLFFLRLCAVLIRVLCALAIFRSSVCSHTCLSAADGECDDGGADAPYDSCVLGTDCSDCGSRLNYVQAVVTLHGLSGALSLALVIASDRVVGRAQELHLLSLAAMEGVLL
ncbi:hypothetical protein EMIHUDRAFT_242988 [Emiliania huxleyi CCMP1516]|uniref:Uncharacterized protein n=2 Tax=Emiliania huxleyi TaxID=2903 RepID=A0A0D3J730_EMIH1|nr:hypothetical protein EMIHUDRAFT_242988 [Emiliania huxleyi CCMP1516]EOD19315.1 hypothetical protein EMIHUDRAFT_242988 [Emiliania huxleyi CCMP1516]|eukprot:XP_005771744.1 hypothetical protein EMIHUDRAFT_242988 [Emiliania huxleyi CCMP1516]